MLRTSIIQAFNASQGLLSAMLADDSLLQGLELAAQTCAGSLRSGAKILLAGNGGSAAQAQHIACELVGRFAMERPGLPAIALSTDSSIITAVANDYGFDRIFERQVDAHGRAGDVLVAYSTSGNSANILAALRAARARGLFCLGMSGAGGGAMTGLCDLLLQVPSADTPRVQEAHLLLGHALCALVESELFGVSS
jgi:D-sedoheptulose 7-phosphate isomerase